MTHNEAKSKLPSIMKLMDTPQKHGFNAKPFIFNH